MGILTIALGVPLLVAGLWPSLPISNVITSLIVAASIWLQDKITVGRGLIGISVVLLLFAAFWALQGDAPMFVTMALPELAAWVSTFEIVTLVEVIIGLGWAALAFRAMSWVTLWRGSTRAHRRRQPRTAKKPSNANDDDRTVRLAEAA